MTGLRIKPLDEQLAALEGKSIKQDGTDTASTVQTVPADGGSAEFDKSEQIRRLEEYREAKGWPVHTIERMKQLTKKYGSGIDMGIKIYASDGNAYPITFNGLNVITARSGHGKTVMLVNLAAQFLERNNGAILFISLEQPEQEIQAMLLASLSRKTGTGDPYKDVTINRIHGCLSHGNFLGQPDCMRAQKTIEASVLITDTEQEQYDYLNYVDAIANQIIEFRETAGTNSAVFIDYIQLVKPCSDITGAGWEKMGATIDRLRKAAKKSGAVVFFAAQSNGEAGKNNKGGEDDPHKELAAARLENLRESSAIGHAAETVLYCCPLSQTEIAWKTLKNRKGRNDLIGTYPLDFAAASVDFTRPQPYKNPNDGSGTGKGTAQNEGVKTAYKSVSFSE